MKKILYMMILSALSCACTKNVEVVDPYSQGVRVGEILLGATQGRVTVSVETEGLWRVVSDQPWLKTDVNGRNGDGAFTVYYESNESDVHVLKQERVAKVAILLDKSMKADTLVFVQRGLYPAKATGKVVNDPALKLEYRIEQQKEFVLVCCCSDGEGDVQAWLETQKADIVVLDGEVTPKDFKDFKVVGCNFDEIAMKDTSETQFQAFRKRIQETYNSGPYAEEDYIFAGQMYHLSAMQTDYLQTPEKYPQSTSDPRLKSDIYAWQNNLYDCVWMFTRDYVQTWTDADGNSFCADYIYASASLFNKVESVELIDVEGLTHKAIRLTLKY